MVGEEGYSVGAVNSPVKKGINHTTIKLSLI